MGRIGNEIIRKLKCIYKMNSYEGVGVQDQAFNPDVNERANYEGDHSELTLNRAETPVIFNQIVNLIHEAQLDAEKRFASLSFSPVTADEDFPKDLADQFLRGSDGAYYNKTKVKEGYPAQSAEEIEQKIRNAIAEQRSATAISYKNDFPDNLRMPNMECIPINWSWPDGSIPTLRQKNIVESHEKGHNIRPYFYDYLNQYFSKGFDISALNISSVEGEALIKTFGRNRPETTVESAKKDLIRYLFSAPEIAERMSQLKNYFGLKGEEEFTLEHLRYSKNHYIEDTGVDNDMTYFFRTITEGTQDEFIRLINSSGI